MADVNTEEKRRDFHGKRESTQVSHEDNNPCLKEQDLSYKCLNDNAYDRDKCSLYFQNYRNCKKFWQTVARLRRRDGIKPNMPPANERQPYIEKYRKLWPSNSSNCNSDSNGSGDNSDMAV